MVWTWCELCTGCHDSCTRRPRGNSRPGRKNQRKFRKFPNFLCRGFLAAAVWGRCRCTGIARSTPVPPHPHRPRALPGKAARHPPSRLPILHVHSLAKPPATHRPGLPMRVHARCRFTSIARSTLVPPSPEPSTRAPWKPPAPTVPAARCAGTDCHGLKDHPKIRLTGRG
jgi:hypothetical protein